MEFNNYQTSAEATSPRHRKTPPFSIKGMLGLEQAQPAPGVTSTSPLTTHPVAQVQMPAIRHPASRFGRRRRVRTVYTPEQMEALESVFAANQYPDINSRDTLADALDMTEARVLVWFQNRRARLRRQAKRKSSSSPSETSSSSSTHSELRQMGSPSAETTATNPHRLSPETASMKSQLCTQACCSPPNITCTDVPCCSSGSCSSTSHYPVNMMNFSDYRYGLSQQYGAFTYAYYPYQYAYNYRPSAYTTVTSAYQGSPICSVSEFPPVVKMEPITM